MLAYKRNVKEISIKVYKTKLKQYCISTTWETRGIKEEDQQMQSNKLTLLTTKRKGDTSHGTHTKHQLQLFKLEWYLENSIPSINLSISTILICFRFTPCWFTWGFCCCCGMWEQRIICSVKDICCMFGLPVTLPSTMIDNQLGDKQINSWQWQPSVLSAYFLPLHLCLY